MDRPSSAFQPVDELTAQDVRRALDYASLRTMEELRIELGANASVKYLLVDNGEGYEAKVIVQLAWNLKFPHNTIAANEFRGDRSHVAQPLRALGFDVIEIGTERVFGHVKGFPVGSMFINRVELSEAYVHRPRQAGISGAGSQGADSIVVSGGYVDDEDFGNRIIYTGHGGNDPNSKRQISDQVLERGNLALATSCNEGLPVRVIRGAGGDPVFSPATGYRYDGLFEVTRYWPETGIDGFRVWRFELQQLEDEERAQAGHLAMPAGTDEPERQPGKIGSRIKRKAQLSQWVKEVHDWTCQMCGERVVTPAGGYAEAAHITPLGAPHNGPDQPSNMLCLCPNCHRRFDSLARYIDEHDNVIEGATGVLVGSLRRHPEHRISNDHLVAHRNRALLANHTGR